MVKVRFLGPIKHEDMDVNALNLGELKEILAANEDLKEWLEICAVAVNDKIASSLQTRLKAGDEILILPPVCGG